MKHSVTYGPAQSVVDVLNARRASNSKPQHRGDNHRVALAVEGGGMRGIVTGAMLTALQDMGFRTAFDAVYALSAGAINSAYFLVHDGWSVLSVYYDDLLTDEFFDIVRLIQKKPMLSLEYVFDTVIAKRKPLDYEAVLASPITLGVAVTCVDDVRSNVLTEFAHADELRTALMAASWIPIVAGPPIIRDGVRLLDGRILLAHPLIAAVDDGCTHIVALRTHAGGPVRARPAIYHRLLARHLDRMSKGLGPGYLSTFQQYAQLWHDQPAEGHYNGIEPAVLEVRCRPGAHAISRFERNRGKLYEGMRAGYAAMIRALGRDSEVFLRPALPRRDG